MQNGEFGRQANHLTHYREDDEGTSQSQILKSMVPEESNDRSDIFIQSVMRPMNNIRMATACVSVTALIVLSCATYVSFDKVERSVYRSRFHEIAENVKFVFLSDVAAKVSRNQHERQVSSTYHLRWLSRRIFPTSVLGKSRYHFVHRNTGRLTPFAHKLGKRFAPTTAARGTPLFERYQTELA